MKNLGMVAVTGELLSDLLKPLFQGNVPPKMVIMKIVASQSPSYTFYVVYSSSEDGEFEVAEGAYLPRTTYSNRGKT